MFLENLKIIDLRENAITKFTSFPKSKKLETVLLSFNQISHLGGFGNSPNIVTFDIKNNKLQALSDEIFVLKNMKILDLSNNDLQNLPPELGLLKNLNKLQVEGNPLKTIRLAVRQGGSETIKKYLASRIDPNSTQHDGNDAKSALVKEEMQEKPSAVSKLVLLIRQLKNPNGDLDLKGKNLTTADISEDILKAEKVKCLDISQNRLDAIPEHIDQINPTSLRLNSNAIKTVTVAEIINFTCLKEIEIKTNKMTSFCEEQLVKEDALLIQMNFAQLTYLDLSQNNLSTIPPVFHEFKNLRSLIMAYNSISSLEDLFKEGGVPQIDHLDFSNNSLTEVPSRIYKWQSMSSLILQNNNIKNFPPELGFLNLKNLNISGNPSLLLRGALANRGVSGILDYLKDRSPNRPQLEAEVAKIRSQPYSLILPQKKPSDLVEYEFPDPFKQKANDYSSKQDAMYGEVYEEDLKKKLKEQKSRRMDEEQLPGKKETVNHARGQHKFQHDQTTSVSNNFGDMPAKKETVNHALGQHKFKQTTSVSNVFGEEPIKREQGFIRGQHTNHPDQTTGVSNIFGEEPIKREQGFIRGQHTNHPDQTTGVSNVFGEEPIKRDQGFIRGQHKNHPDQTTGVSNVFGEEPIPREQGFIRGQHKNHPDQTTGVSNVFGEEPLKREQGFIRGQHTNHPDQTTGVSNIFGEEPIKREQGFIRGQHTNHPGQTTSVSNVFGEEPIQREQGFIRGQHKNHPQQTTGVSNIFGEEPIKREQGFIRGQHKNHPDQTTGVSNIFGEEPIKRDQGFIRGQHKNYPEQTSSVADNFGGGKSSIASSQVISQSESSKQSPSKSKREDLEMGGNQAQPSGSNKTTTDEKKELDVKIKQLQDKLDNDYTLNKAKIAEMKKELTQMRVQRNQMN